MPEVNRPRTWGDLMEFVQKNGLDREEYFSLSNSAWVDDDQELWTPDTRWLAAYWVEGGSEGYYVHVDRLDRNPAIEGLESKTMAVGKFWSKGSAAIAVTLLTPWLYGLYPV